MPRPGDDVLDQAAQRVDPAVRHLVRRPACAVKPLLGLMGRAAEAFRPHLGRVEAGRRSESIDPQPALALLPLPTAVENVHETNSKAADDYCGRRAQVLDFTWERTDRCTNAYRRSTKGTLLRRAVAAAGDATEGAYRPTSGATWRLSRPPRNVVGRRSTGLRPVGLAALGAE